MLLLQTPSAVLVLWYYRIQLLIGYRTLIGLSNIQSGHQGDGVTTPDLHAANGSCYGDGVLTV